MITLDHGNTKEKYVCGSVSISRRLFFAERSQDALDYTPRGRVRADKPRVPVDIKKLDELPPYISYSGLSHAHNIHQQSFPNEVLAYMIESNWFVLFYFFDV